MATIVKDLGAVTAYAYAKEKGYTGTEDEFAELMASYADVAEQATDSAAQAVASATAAEQAKANAASSASAAASSASTAITKASEAASSASSAAGSANTATTKANEASTSATNAASSASAAATSATNAGASATAAASLSTAASNAQAAAETAQGKAEDAQTAAEDAAASVSESAAQITQNAEDIADIKNAINDKAPVIIDTASGSIASFPDGADSIPVKDLTVGIEPAQDLHGYDNPWPAGCGVNLLPPFMVQSTTYESVTLTCNNGEYTLNGTTGDEVAVFDVDIDLPAGQYTVSLNNPTANGKVEIYVIDENISVPLQLICSTANATATATFSATVKKFRIRVLKNGTVDNFKFSPVLSAGATAVTGFYPYENICPISGWTGANVTRTGVNVWDEETEIGRLNTNTGADESSSAQLRTKNYVPVIGGKTYYFGTPMLTGSGQGMWILFYDDSKSVISGYTPPESVDKYQNAFRPQNRAMTVPANAKYFRFYLTPEYGTTYSGNIFINYPSTYTSYSPYAGSTYSITFPTEAGTVYGGTLDVTTGKLTVDRVKEKKQWGGSQYQTVIGTVARKEITLSSVAVYPPTTGKPQLSSIAPYKAAYFDDSVHFYINGNRVNQLIIFLPVDTSDDTEFEVSYELATPIVYDLTPTEVRTLLGTNNIWADTGDSIVEYRADTKLYIDKKIAALAAAMN